MCTGGGRREGVARGELSELAPPAGAASSHDTAVLAGRGLWSTESSTTAEAVVIWEPPADICSLPRSVSTSAEGEKDREGASHRVRLGTGRTAICSCHVVAFSHK